MDGVVECCHAGWGFGFRGELWDGGISWSWCLIVLYALVLYYQCRAQGDDGSVRLVVVAQCACVVCRTG